MQLGYAYAWRSGKIEIGPAVPDGAITVARGGLMHHACARTCPTCPNNTDNPDRQED